VSSSTCARRNGYPAKKSPRSFLLLKQSADYTDYAD
jgi:hypothetical protein